MRNSFYWIRNLFVRSIERLQSLDAFVGFVIFFRVGLALLVWVALFLGLFLGYFTFPVLLVGILLLLYAVLDLGLFVRIQRQERAREARRAYLQEQHEKSKED